ncbi:gamma carbonic anhydrase family protein [Streptomyces globisporus]|uniref:gamma carbonic anhydrase family protein n=1 Tax=Streptomyces globisporus TaxID=1908 RepID=UPI0036A5F236
MAMLITHEGRSPSVHPTAYVAPNATLCGDVRVAADCRVLFGAVLTAEGGPVELGEGSIVMENAVLRGTRRDPRVLGRQVLVGPTSGIGEVQKELDFPGYVFGLDRPGEGRSLMPAISERFGRRLGRHNDDHQI